MKSQDSVNPINKKLQINDQGRGLQTNNCDLLTRLITYIFNRPTSNIQMSNYNQIRNTNLYPEYLTLTEIIPACKL